MPPRRVAVVLLAVRLSRSSHCPLWTRSGFSRVLYLLLPFTAYFSLGRRVSYAVGRRRPVAWCWSRRCGRPGGPGDPEVVSDVLMFCVGLVFAITMAAVAAEEEAARTELEESHRQLTAYAAQAATLAAVTSATGSPATSTTASGTT